MTGKPLHIFIGLLLYSISIAQEVPKITHFTRQDYKAQNQNWDIAQRNDRQIFVGNSSGLLQFDGARWKLHTTPSGQVIRAVECDSTGKVFVGGFETIGYWEASGEGQFSYHSLLETFEGEGLGNEEIWHILLLKGKVLFQSFSTIYIYDYQSVKVIRPPGNIMFSRAVNGDVIVPVIGEGLFRFQEDGSFQKLPGSGIFNNMLVSDMLPSGESDLLVCTQNNGIYQFSNGVFSPWDMPVNKELVKMQFNKGLQLRNGGYAFGTILGGIYITAPDGQLLSAISQENGLQNNTVLSLFQDQAGQLWTGLDNGIDQVVLDSPLKFFQDKTGEIGTVYAAAIFDGNIYLGTNHGIFYKKYSSVNRDELKLIAGSQGQVWDLQVVDDQLVGSHNSGLIHIKGSQVGYLYSGTGVYSSIRHPDKPDVLLLGTYTGAVVIRRNAAGMWELGNGLEGFPQSSRKLFFDKQNRLWVLHARKGLFRLTLDEAMIRPVKIESIGEGKGLPSAFQLDMAKVGSEIIFKSGQSFFTYDEGRESFVKIEAYGNEALPAGNYLLQGGSNGDWFKIFPNQVQYFDGEHSSFFHLPLVRGNERIVSLSGDSYLFCLEDGYAILPPGSSKVSHQNILAPPLLTGLTVGNDKTHLDALSNVEQPYSFGPSENQLTFQFACPHFTYQPAMRYRLLGLDDKWSPFETIYSKEFTYLPPGDYTFQVQSELSGEEVAFLFSIQPKWYKTTYAKGLYFLLFIGTFSLLLKWHDRRMEAQRRKLEIVKERELEQQRTHANNQILQAEIINKSRILADTTMNLIRKNEMLMKIKDELDLATRKKNSEPPIKALTKMEHLIDAHLTNEEDWQVFEANFNQLHNQFFKRLKDQYADLKPGDLRLAAYLKMNLSSKEIAPLLNISTRGVENKRYRLRHKMGLGGEVNLTEYLMGY